MFGRCLLLKVSGWGFKGLFLHKKATKMYRGRCGGSEESMQILKEPKHTHLAKYPIFSQETSTAPA